MSTAFETEASCPKCGKLLSQCTCSKDANKVIEIRHTGIPHQGAEEFEKLKKQKEDYERIIALQAEKDFRSELAEFLSQLDDDEKRDEIKAMIGEDPERLENAKIMSRILEQAIVSGGGRVTGRRKPSGKASLPPKDTGLLDGYKAYVDTLYSTLRDPSKSDLEKETANSMLDQLFFEMVKGLRVAKGKYGHAIAPYQVMECPNCQMLLTGERGEEIDYCPSCGWQKYVKSARRV